MMERNYTDENGNNLKELIVKMEHWIDDNGLQSHENMVSQFALNLWNGRQKGWEFEVKNELNLEPDWLDLEKLKLGQKFAKDFYLPISTSELIALLLILSHDGVLRKLISTGKSSDPYTSFKRYLSTGKRVKSWLMDDLFSDESEANQNISIVNAMHRNFCRSYISTDREEFVRKTELPDVKFSVCPYIARDMSKISTYVGPQPTELNDFPITQSEMTGTLFSFCGFLILSPESFGICPVKYRKGLEGFVHLWRYLGYRLGTSDQHNICTGTYEDVLIKCKFLLDFLIIPDLKEANARWEHMTRCIVQGLRFSVNAFSYEAHLLFGLDIVNLNCPSFYAKSSLKARAEYRILKLLYYYLMPIDSIRSFITKRVLSQVEKLYTNIPSEKEFYKKNV